MYLSTCLCVAWSSQLSEIYRDSEKLKKIHKTQSRFLLGSYKPLGEREENKGVLRFAVHPRRRLSPLHRCTVAQGPVWPIRMICPSSFHHPPQDNTGGREQAFQTFGNAPLRVPVGANYQLCFQTQWLFCFAGLLQYQNGKLHRWTNEQI